MTSNSWQTTFVTTIQKPEMEDALNQSAQSQPTLLETNPGISPIYNAKCWVNGVLARKQWLKF